MSPNHCPYHRNALFYFDKDTIQIAETDTSPIIIFARACDINAMSRLDYIFIVGIIPITVINRYGSIFVSALLSVKKAAPFLRLTGTNKLTVSAATRFSDEARLSASAIPLSRRR